MTKSLKIVVRLAWNHTILLEPTVENMALAKTLVEAQAYDIVYDGTETVYYPVGDRGVNATLSNVSIASKRPPVKAANAA